MLKEKKKKNYAKDEKIDIIVLREMFEFFVIEIIYKRNLFQMHDL